MSTDKKRKKKSVPRVERIKIIEYGCIGLVILLFLGLAVFYGGKKDNSTSPEIESTPSPVPTDDPSIRGKNVLDAIDASPFDLTYQQDHYDLVYENDIFIEMRMLSDDNGLKRLSFETTLCPGAEEGNNISDSLSVKNKNTLKALRDLFDLIMPVLHRTVSDSDAIVKQCSKVVDSGEYYSKHLGRFTVRIDTDSGAIPQTVTVEFIRDP